MKATTPSPRRSRSAARSRSGSVPSLPATLLLAAALTAGCGGEAPDAGAEDEYADTLAGEHAGDRPVATPAAGDAGKHPVATRTVAYGEIEGRELTGFLAHPEGAADSTPGLLVVHEWWGLNDNIRDMTRQLAGLGYVALAVDLYGDRIAGDPSRARELVSGVMADRQAAGENLRQAHEWLAERGARRTGVIGWCFGGMWSLQTALLLPERIDATVVYYGPPETSAERLATLGMPVLGHFGAEDGSIPPDTVRRFAQVLDSVGVEAAVHLYEGAGHAFANPSGTRYDEAAAEKAWTRTVTFLAEHLR